jgi:AraC-like DNA-binding protein
MKTLPSTYTVVQELPKAYRAGPFVDHEGQLITVMSGILDLNTQAQVWLLTPQRGLWIPSGLAYSLHARSDVSLCRINIASDETRLGFPDKPGSIAVSSLLRELILRTVSLSPERGDEYKKELILTLILEEISWAEESPLPLPQDERLRRVCRAIMDNPSDRRGLKEWADYTATSSRTLARLFHTQLGMSYQCWRQLALVKNALPRLWAGDAVTQVALELGYETPGAFSAMFRRVMRVCPNEYREGNTERQSA